MHPLTSYRKQSSLTQQALANLVGLSLSTIRKVETGVLETLPAPLLDATSVTNNDHVTWRANKRSASAKALGLDLTLSYPLSYLMSLYPTVNAFCEAYCIRPKHLPIINNKNSPVGGYLVNALSEAGLRLSEANDG